MRIELEDQLQTSFPNPDDVDKIRQLFIEDTKKDILGLESSYSIFVGQKEQ